MDPNPMRWVSLGEIRRQTPRRREDGRLHTKESGFGGRALPRPDLGPPDHGAVRPQWPSLWDLVPAALTSQLKA